MCVCVVCLVGPISLVVPKMPLFDSIAMRTCDGGDGSESDDDTSLVQIVILMMVIY